MQTEHWIELKRTDFLAALKAVKPTVRVKNSPERELQIGLVNGLAIFSVQGASASMPATGSWPGLASIRLIYFLTFLVAKPVESIIRISYSEEKIKVSSARFSARWADNNDLLTIEQLGQHSTTPTKENILKFKCPKCRRKQGVPLHSLPSGPFASNEAIKMLASAEENDHGFACTSCGATWAEQAV